MSDSLWPHGQASLSITNSWSLLKLLSIELVMPSSHLIFCRPLLLLPRIPPSIRVFSNESTLHIRWPKYWSFSFSISRSTQNPSTSLSFHIDSTFKKILIPCVDRRKFTWVQDAAYGVASGPGLYADKALYQRGGMYDCDDDNIVKMK